MQISFQRESFKNRHLGQSESDLKEMLATVGASNVDELIDQTVPKGIRMQRPLNIPAALSEQDFLKVFRKKASKFRK